LRTHRGSPLLAACLIFWGAVPTWSQHAPDVFAAARHHMVSNHLASRDITDTLVLEVMAEVPRHEFVPAHLRDVAYQDRPLPIGEGQTISQPYIVAYMTQSLDLSTGDRVLEIGTGSGYQAAVLARLVEHVYTIEIIQSLGDSARLLLGRQGYDNITAHIGDGYLGWPSEAPFDAIMVTAAPDHVPPALVEQLAEGGRMILPVGDRHQQLLRLTRRAGKIEAESLLPVRFVPMTGEAQK
jgi:protein-L-isoaspartate(D-aspartate) O-methyltransferase